MKKRSAFAPVSLSGSLTLEASLIMTFLVGIFMGFFVLFDVLCLQIRIQQILNDTTEELASYVYIRELLPDLWEKTDEGDDDDTGYSGPVILKAVGDKAKEFVKNGLSTGYLAVTVRKRLENDPFVKRRVVSGSQGLNFAWTFLSIDADYIDARVQYKVKIPGFPDAIGQVTYIQRCRRRCWIGMEPVKRTDDGIGEKEEKEKNTVYITRYGRVYHEYETCSFLLRDIKTLSIEVIVSARNDSGRKYYPCESCVGNKPNEHVYLTREGTRYHNRKNCRVLMRYIQEISRDQTNGKPLCKLCEKRKLDEQKEKEIDRGSKGS